MKTYDVNFVDCRDGYPNHKILTAYSAEEVYAYMVSLGHTEIQIKEREE